MAISALQTAFKAQPREGYITNPPTHIDKLSLAAGVAKNYAVPSGSVWLLFSAPACTFHIRQAGAAALAAGDITDGSASFPNPAGYYVAHLQGTNLSFISAAGGDVYIAVFS